MAGISKWSSGLPVLIAMAGFMLFLVASPEAFLSLPSSQVAYHRVGAEKFAADRSSLNFKAGAASDNAPQPVLLMGAFLLAGTMVFTNRQSVSASSKSMAATSISLCALPAALEGTGGPMYNEVWDPAGLMNGRSEEQILHWRAVELKHCRVSMLAIIGWLHVSAGWHFIGDAAAGFRVSDDPLVNVTQVPMGGMWQLIFTFMALEWVQNGPCPPPKDKPWDVLGWDPILVIDEEYKSKQLQELNNGRLAMLGILGLIGQDAFTGDYAAWIHQPNFGQSNPLDWRGEPPFEMPQLYPMQP